MVPLPILSSLKKKNSNAKGMPNKRLPKLGQLRSDLADALCNVGSHTNGKTSGRPSNDSLEQSLLAKISKINLCLNAKNSCSMDFHVL